MLDAGIVDGYRNNKTSLLGGKLTRRMPFVEVKERLIATETSEGRSEHYQSLSRDTSITQIAFGSASFFDFSRPQATAENTGSEVKKRRSGTPIYSELRGSLRNYLSFLFRRSLRSLTVLCVPGANQSD